MNAQRKEYYINYYQKNKERIKNRNKLYKRNSKNLTEYRKQYYKINKERLLKQKGEKVLCSCGAIVRRDELKKHQNKAKKHLNALEISNCFFID